jgi:hypothetical protein
MQILFQKDFMGIVASFADFVLIECALLRNSTEDTDLQHDVKGLICFEIDQIVIFLQLSHEIIVDLCNSLQIVEDRDDDALGTVEHDDVVFP